jgi:hypothetical protein
MGVMYLGVLAEFLPTAGYNFDSNDFAFDSVQMLRRFLSGLGMVVCS